MKIIFVITTFLAIVNCSKDWHNFKNKHSKQYYTLVEDETRLNIWNDNCQKIDENNKLASSGNVSFFMEVNNLADMTDSELASSRKGFIMPIQNFKITEAFRRKHRLNESSNPIRNSVDWRKHNLVTPVKMQGYSCGSCWAFATAGVLEGQYLKKKKKRKVNKLAQISSLSSQQLVDCNMNNFGCNGGDFGTAFNYAAKSGLELDSSYPYVGYRQNSCQYRSNYSLIYPKTNVPIYNEDDLKYAVATVGPIAITMYAGANSFSFYSRGIYDDRSVCYSNYVPNHAMLAVGYGTENGTDYWIIKNSWGVSWGEEGYVRVRRGLGTCGIGKYAGYASL